MFLNIKRLPQIILTHADKGNVIVVLDEIDYVNKMKILLSDIDTYTIVKHNPTNKVLSDLKDLKTWKSRELVFDHTYNFLNATNLTLPKVYGLLKIHRATHYVLCNRKVFLS